MLKVKQARLSRGLNQQTTAERARMQASELSKIENGRLIPTPRQAQKLAQVLGLRSDELLEPADPQAKAS
jgi:transcriptional regulator with XRE-family HTH domain